MTYSERNSNKNSQEIAPVSFVIEDTGSYDLFELNDFKAKESAMGIKTSKNKKRQVILVKNLRVGSHKIQVLLI